MRRTLLVAVPVAVLLLADLSVRGLIPALFPKNRTTPSRSDTPLPAATRTPGFTVSPTTAATSLPTATVSPSTTPNSAFPATGGSTFTPTATLVPPRGLVRVQANCRYGPGAAYLYEWGLYAGDRVDIVGRNDLGTWLYVDPWYYVDKCWVQAALLDITGDPFSVQPYYGLLPYSELYQPPTSVSSVRDGDQLTISWPEVWMTVDDYRGYLIEAWVCVDRQIVFTPVAIDGTVVTITDEGGCQQPSSGRLYTAEKHGYTAWRRIPWPAYPVPTPTATEPAVP